MKILARDGEIAEQVRLVLQPRGNQVHDRHGRGFDALHKAVHGEQRRAEQFAAVLLGGCSPDDDVDSAGLILERDESDTAGGR